MFWNKKKDEDTASQGSQDDIAPLACSWPPNFSYEEFEQEMDAAVAECPEFLEYLKKIVPSSAVKPLPTLPPVYRTKEEFEAAGYNMPPGTSFEHATRMMEQKRLQVHSQASADARSAFGSSIADPWKEWQECEKYPHPAGSGAILRPPWSSVKDLKTSFVAFKRKRAFIENTRKYMQKVHFGSIEELD